MTAKEEVKVAKANWRLKLRTNLAKVREDQTEIVQAILKSPIPKWGGINLRVIKY